MEGSIGLYWAFHRTCSFNFPLKHQGISDGTESSYSPRAVHLAHHLRLRYIPRGGFMDILAAIKREERKLEKQLGS